MLYPFLHFAEHKSWFIMSQADCLWDSHSYNRVISLLITLAKICNLRGKEPDTFWIFIWQLKSYLRKHESKCTKCAKIFPRCFRLIFHSPQTAYLEQKINKKCIFKEWENENVLFHRTGGFKLLKVKDKVPQQDLSFVFNPFRAANCSFG